MPEDCTPEGRAVPEVVPRPHGVPPNGPDGTYLPLPPDAESLAATVETVQRMYSDDGPLKDNPALPALREAAMREVEISYMRSGLDMPRPKSAAAIVAERHAAAFPDTILRGLAPIVAQRVALAERMDPGTRKAAAETLEREMNRREGTGAHFALVQAAREALALEDRGLADLLAHDDNALRLLAAGAKFEKAERALRPAAAAMDPEAAAAIIEAARATERPAPDYGFGAMAHTPGRHHNPRGA